jgi:fatty-acyl-CoA synthase
VEPATVAFHAVRRSGLRLGDVAVVQGAGPIGLLTLQWVRAAGAGLVIVVEPSGARRALARRLGADLVVAPGAEAAELVAERTAGLGADIVYECVGLPKAIQSGVDLARRGGELCLIGVADADASITPLVWVVKEITLTSALAYLHHEFETAMGMILDGRVQVEPLHSATASLAGSPAPSRTSPAGPRSRPRCWCDPRGDTRPSTRRSGSVTMHPNFATLYEAIAASDPRAEAIIQGDRRIDWGQLDDVASRVAGALTGWGLRPGDRIGLYLRNGPEYLELAYGAFKARAVPVNINYRYLAGEVDHLLRDSDARVLVFEGSLAATVRGCEALAGRVLVQVDDGAAPLLDGARWYHDVIAGTEPLAPVERSGDDQLILYTGGTTGMPKGVVWRHGDLFQTLGFAAYSAVGLAIPTSPEEAAAVAARLRADGAAPVLLSAPPLIHGTALFLAMSAFLRGGAVVLLSSGGFDADELWRQVQEERVTDLAIVGDPFARPMVRALEAADARGEPYDISSVRIISSSGIAWGADAKRGLRARGQMVLLDMLGASEGGPFATSMTLPGRSRRRRRRSRSRSAPCCSTRTAGRSLPGPTGWVCSPTAAPARSATTATRRRRRPRSGPSTASATWCSGTWRRSQADGTVTFLGRGSTCINTGGEKVYPEEVEDVLRGHPAVTDCYVVGVPDETYGEAVTAVVMASRPVADEELVDHVRSRLAGYKRPRHVVQVDELVRSPTGKSDYAWARDVASQALGRR